MQPSNPKSMSLLSNKPCKIEFHEHLKYERLTQSTLLSSSSQNIASVPHTHTHTQTHTREWHSNCWSGYYRVDLVGTFMESTETPTHQLDVRYTASAYFFCLLYCSFSPHFFVSDYLPLHQMHTQLLPARSCVSWFVGVYAQLCHTDSCQPQTDAHSFVFLWTTCNNNNNIVASGASSCSSSSCNSPSITIRFNFTESSSSYDCCSNCISTTFTHSLLVVVVPNYIYIFMLLLCLKNISWIGFRWQSWLKVGGTIGF